MGNESIKDFLKATLKANDYESFHDKIGLTRTRFTQMLRDPLSISGRELITICRELDMPIKRFVNDFLQGLYDKEEEEELNSIHLTTSDNGNNAG